MKKLSSEPITAAESLDILKKRKKEGELGYEQEITIDVLKKTVKLALKDSKKLKEELEGLVFLKPWMIAKIVDIVPATEEEVRAVFDKYRTGLKKQEFQKIAEIASKYL